MSKRKSFNSKDTSNKKNKSSNSTTSSDNDTENNFQDMIKELGFKNYNNSNQH